MLLVLAVWVDHLVAPDSLHSEVLGLCLREEVTAGRTVSAPSLFVTPVQVTVCGTVLNIPTMTCTCQGGAGSTQHPRRMQMKRRQRGVHQFSELARRLALRRRWRMRLALPPLRLPKAVVLGGAGEDPPAKRLRKRRNRKKLTVVSIRSLLPQLWPPRPLCRLLLLQLRSHLQFLKVLRSNRNVRSLKFAWSLPPASPTLYLLSRCRSQGRSCRGRRQVVTSLLRISNRPFRPSGSIQRSRPIPNLRPRSGNLLQHQDPRVTRQKLRLLLLLRLPLLSQLLPYPAEALVQLLQDRLGVPKRRMRKKKRKKRLLKLVETRFRRRPLCRFLRGDGDPRLPRP